MKEYKKIIMNVCNYCGFKALFVKDIKKHLRETHIMRRKLKQHYLSNVRGEN